MTEDSQKEVIAPPAGRWRWGEYGDVTWAPDRLLVDHLTEAAEVSS